MPEVLNIFPTCVGVFLKNRTNGADDPLYVPTWRGGCFFCFISSFLRNPLCISHVAWGCFHTTLCRWTGRVIIPHVRGGVSYGNKLRPAGCAIFSPRAWGVLFLEGSICRYIIIHIPHVRGGVCLSCSSVLGSKSRLYSPTCVGVFLFNVTSWSHERCIFTSRAWVCFS